MSTKANLGPETSWPSLPITIVPGQPVFDLADGTPGLVVGVTEAYCLYRTQDSRLAVSSWRETAVSAICPAAQLLPREVTASDVRNASARLLRELLARELVAPLTENQRATREELVKLLCG